MQNLFDLQINSEESPLFENNEINYVQAALNMETAATNSHNLAQLQPQNFLNDFNMLFPSNPFSLDPSQMNLMSNAVG